MSKPKIEPWMELAAMEQAREIWPGSAQEADQGIQEGVNDLRELSQKLAAIIARHAKSEGVNERELVERLAFEFGYRCCEKGMNLEMALCKYDEAKAK